MEKQSLVSSASDSDRGAALLRCFLADVDLNQESLGSLRMFRDSESFKWSLEPAKVGLSSQQQCFYMSASLQRDLQAVVARLPE